MAQPIIVNIIALDNTGGAFTQVEKKAKKLEQGLNQTVNRAKLLGVAAAGASLVAVNEFAKFDKGLREISTLLDNVTKREIDAMGKRLQKLGRETGQAIEPLLRAQYDIISAGFTDAAQSAEVLNVSARLAAGGITEVSNTADVLTSVLNAYGPTSLSAAKASDILFTTVRLGKTTVDELSQSMGVLASTAPNIGVSFETLGAAVATLTARGLDTRETVVSLNAVMTALLKPSKALEGALGDLGFASGTAIVKQEGLAGAIKLLSEGVSEADLAARFENVRAIRAIFPLAGRAAGDFAKNLEEMQDVTGATDAAFEKLKDSAALNIQRIRSIWNGALIDIGRALVPLVELVAKAARGFAEFSDGARVAIGAITGVVAVGKTLAPLIGALVANAGGLSAALGAVGAALTGPVGIVIGIGAAITAIVLFATRMTEAEAAVADFREDIEGISSLQARQELGTLTQQIKGSEAEMVKLRKQFAENLVLGIDVSGAEDELTGLEKHLDIIIKKRDALGGDLPNIDTTRFISALTRGEESLVKFLGAFEEPEAVTVLDNAIGGLQQRLGKLTAAKIRVEADGASEKSIQKLNDGISDIQRQLALVTDIDIAFRLDGVEGVRREFEELNKQASGVSDQEIKLTVQRGLLQQELDIVQSQIESVFSENTTKGLFESLQNKANNFSLDNLLTQQTALNEQLSRIDKVLANPKLFQIDGSAAKQELNGIGNAVENVPNTVKLKIDAAALQQDLISNLRVNTDSESSNALVAQLRAELKSLEEQTVKLQAELIVTGDKEVAEKLDATQKQAAGLRDVFNSLGIPAQAVQQIQSVSDALKAVEGGAVSFAIDAEQSLEVLTGITSEINNLQALLSVRQSLGIETEEDQRNIELLQSKITALTGVQNSALDISFKVDDVGAVQQVAGVINAIEAQLAGPFPVGVDADGYKSQLDAQLDLARNFFASLTGFDQVFNDSQAASRANAIAAETDARTSQIEAFRSSFSDILRGITADEQEQLFQRLFANQEHYASLTELTEAAEGALKEIRLQSNLEQIEGMVSNFNQVVNALLKIEQARIKQVQQQTKQQEKEEKARFEKRKKNILANNTVNGKLTEQGHQLLEQLEQGHEGNLARIRSQGAEQERRIAKQFKAVKLAQAITNTALAVTNVLKLPFPFNFAAAAAVGAAGAVQIGTIASSDYQEGGIVSAGADRLRKNETRVEFRQLGTDDVPAVLTAGEAVLRKDVVAKNRAVVDRLLAGDRLFLNSELNNEQQARPLRNTSSSGSFNSRTNPAALFQNGGLAGSSQPSAPVSQNVVLEAQPVAPDFQQQQAGNTINVSVVLNAEFINGEGLADLIQSEEFIAPVVNAINERVLSLETVSANGQVQIVKAVK